MNKRYFDDLYKLAPNLNDPGLTILGARPAMGKTCFGLCYLLQTALDGHDSIYFSIEGTEEQLKNRLSEIDKGNPGEGLSKAIKKIEIVDFYANKLSCLEESLDLFRDDIFYDVKPAVMVIDYLQLFESGTIFSKRCDEIDYMVREIRDFAKRNKIHVLLLSQLSRKVEERSGHRPIMTDLRDSGSLEEIADCVLFLLRRDYYDPMDKPGMAEIIVAKNRNGSTGTCNLVFRREIGEFANYTPIDQIETESDDRYFAF